MKKKTVDRKIVIAVWVVGVVLVWELAALLIRSVIPVNVPDQKLPFFHDVLINFTSTFSDLASSAWVTFENAAKGFAIGTIIGCVVAFVMSWSKAIEKVLYPYLITSQMIPVLGLAPIIYKIVGGGESARVAISAFISFFPVAVNLLSGFNSVDVQRKELLYSYSTSKPAVYWKLMIPSALPQLFVGMKIGAPRTITAAILIEMMGTTEGIGVRILYALYYIGGSSLTFWSCVIMAALLGMLSYLVVSIVEAIIIPWEKAMIKKGAA
ncbi:MAG: ABC transporter permease subunit [Clostridia bacterium]|nr:ABC transporter permease subunit [Clostridia bacterium]